MELRESIIDLLEFYGLIIGVAFTILKGWRWFLDSEEKRHKDLHLERAANIEKELKLAEYKQLTIHDVIELQSKVHEMETKVGELDRNIDMQNEDEVKHRADMKAVLAEVKQSMKELHEKFYKYLEERYSKP